MFRDGSVLPSLVFNMVTYDTIIRGTEGEENMQVTYL